MLQQLSKYFWISGVFLHLTQARPATAVVGSAALKSLLDNKNEKAYKYRSFGETGLTSNFLLILRTNTQSEFLVTI